MKKKLSFLLICTLFLLSFNRANAQNNSSDKEILTILRDFYTSYITIVSNDADEKKLNILKNKYCTVTLLNKIKKQFKADETDYDPFLKAQDSNVEFLKTLSEKKDLKSQNVYIVSYMAYHKITINLRVINDKGTFKIDSIW